MAVDVRTLRIGSHVLVDGKRERVRGLDEDNGLIVRFPAEYVNANEVEPIPITAGLLAELGFARRYTFYGKAFNGCYARFHFEEEISRCVMKIYESKDSILNNMLICRADVCYLHEAESFLALHGVELITE